MKIAELIIELQKFSQDAEIFVARRKNDGCDTCGAGETSSECDFNLIDLETKVIIEASE